MCLNTEKSRCKLFFFTNFFVKINIQRNDGYTALARVCVNGCEDIVELLLKCDDIDINIQIDNRWTAFQVITKLHNKNVVFFLRKKTALCILVFKLKASPQKSIHSRLNQIS